jgi:hypothetical protein
MHAMLATRPNTIPPAVTTGCGPNGRKTVYYQAPEVGAPAPEADVKSRNQQYCMLLDVIEAAKAAQQGSNPATEPLSATSSADMVADKENQPPMTPKPAYTASMAKVLVDKAMSNVKKVAPRPSLEDTLIKLSR